MWKKKAQSSLVVIYLFILTIFSPASSLENKNCIIRLEDLLESWSQKGA